MRRVLVIAAILTAAPATGRGEELLREVFPVPDVVDAAFRGGGLAAFDPFNVFIKDLRYFQHGPDHTICLDILNKMDLIDIFEKLVKGNTTYIPFISIAQALNHDEFSTVWPHFQDFRYRQDFLCDRITVLIRSGHGWLHYRDLMFGGV